MDDQHLRIAKYDTPPASLPFSSRHPGAPRLPLAAERALAAIETMSRRIDDLARELNCLGHYGDEGDGPRAA